jgi:carbon-monoxide dehydrogenase medium subunit
VTGAGPKAVRATSAEDGLTGSSLDDAAIEAAAAHAGDGIDFNADIHASADYRAHLVTVFAARAIRTAASRVS